MTFHLNISGLAAYVNIGVYNWERVLQQKVEINVSISPVDKKGDRYIDYSVFTKKLVTLLSGQYFFLLEDAVEALSGYIACEYPFITYCHIEMRKPAVTFGCSKSISIAHEWSR
ncbi:MAG: dihydroneopterin aldolase [Aaplasma endosymbiont of Hyalomma asiaticum]